MTGEQTPLRIAVEFEEPILSALAQPGELIAFIAESNRIEGLWHDPRTKEVEVYQKFLSHDQITVAALESFVTDVAGKPLRESVGMNVVVGNHRPTAGGPHVRAYLVELLAQAEAMGAYETHVAYEHLHPFLDGNGRSGRALWLWQMLREGRDPYVMRRGFLHTFYYQTLAASRPGKVG